MEVVLTSRHFVEYFKSGFLTATADGELLVGNYDLNDSLTTGYIVFPVGYIDAIWTGFRTIRVRGWLKYLQETIDIPAFKLAFTKRKDLELLKGETINPSVPFGITDFYGFVLFQADGWRKVAGSIYTQEVSLDTVLPANGQDIQAFGIVTAPGSFAEGEELTFELLIERV